MLTEYLLYAKEQEIPVVVVRSRRRTLGLEIKNGIVKARIPFCLSDRDLTCFIEKHGEWILSKLEKAEQRKENAFPDIVSFDMLSKQERAAIKESFLKKADGYAALMGLNYGRLTVRDQRTRWGSCSSKGNLNFNYRLYFLPERLMDYVIVHELVHRIHMNHSKAFWNEVERYYPGYKSCRKELKELAAVLPN